MKNNETPQEALDRIQSGFSNNDIVSIYYFAACGVEPNDIDPRQNVLTFKAWKAKGRCVAKGAKGCPLTVWIQKKDTKTGETKTFPRTTRVFHELQTVAVDSEKGTPSAANGNPYLIDPEAANDEWRTETIERVQAEAVAAVEAQQEEAKTCPA